MIRLTRVTTTYYCAGMVSKGGRIVRTAPILGKYTGWQIEKAIDHLKRKGAKIISKQIGLS